MIEYLKIDTPFERDMDGTKKLIEGKFRNETVEYLKDNVWVWTEKIDGTNIGVVWDGHSVSFQGRTEKAVIPKPLHEKLESMFCGTTNEEIFEQMFGEKQFILFGEGYGNKIQKCGAEYIPDDCSFILFDVYAVDRGIWLERENVESIAKSLSIDVVPIVNEGTIGQAVAFVKSRPISNIGKAQMEGVVCRPKVEVLDRQGKRLIVKIKACDF